MSNLHKPQTLLGFDFGLSHIGVAIGQTVTKTAKPLTALKAEQGIPSWNQVAEIIKEWRPDALIVGIPLNMDGTEQPITQAAKKFMQAVAKRFKLPVFEVDERLTTIEAKDHLFKEGGYKALNKPAIDAVSAQIILESWMNQQGD